MRTSGLVLDVASQVGGASPGVATLYDKSRFANNGAMIGLTWSQISSGLRVINFGGVYGNRVVFPNSASLSKLGSGISVMFWMSSPPGGTNVIYQWALAQRSFQLSASADKMVCYISDDGSVNAGHFKQYTSSLSAFTSSYNLIGFTFNSSGLSLFVNGVLDPAPVKTADGAISTMFSSNQDIVMYTDVASKMALGRIWNHALSPARIRDLYTAERRLFGV